MNEYGLEEGDTVEVNRLPDTPGVFGARMGWNVEMKVYAVSDNHAFLALTEEELRELPKHAVRSFEYLCVPRDEPDRHENVKSLEAIPHEQVH